MERYEDIGDYCPNNMHSLDINLPALDIKMPSLDTNSPSLDSNLPSRDINSPSLRINSPSLHIKSPSLHIKSSSLDRKFPPLHILNNCISAYDAARIGASLDAEGEAPSEAPSAYAEAPSKVNIRLHPAQATAVLNHKAEIAGATGYRAGHDDCIVRPAGPNEHRHNQGSGENQSHRETESVADNTAAQTGKHRKTGTSARKPKKAKRWSRHCHLCNKGVPSDAPHPFLCKTEVCLKAVCAKCSTNQQWTGKPANMNPFKCPHCLRACAAMIKKPQCARYGKYGKTRKQNSSKKSALGKVRPPQALPEHLKAAIESPLLQHENSEQTHSLSRGRPGASESRIQYGRRAQSGAFSTASHAAQSTAPASRPQPTVQGGLMTVNFLPASGEIPPQRNFTLESRLSPFDAQFKREQYVATQSGQIQKTMQHALTQLSESLQGCPELHTAHNALGVLLETNNKLARLLTLQRESWEAQPMLDQRVYAQTRPGQTNRPSGQT